MKTAIHPDYVEATVSCSCGNTFTTHSTVPKLHVELCNECHPFYTGKQKLVDTGGRIDRFERRYGRRKNSKVHMPDDDGADEAKADEAKATAPKADEAKSDEATKADESTKAAESDA